MNKQFTNRRGYYRIDFDGHAELDFGDELHNDCRVKNLCLTGAFVTGDFQQEHPEFCRITIPCSNEPKGRHLDAEAKVVWKNDVGVGLQFTSMTFNSYKLLQKTLISESEEPLRLLDEFPIKSPFEISRL